jgi:hypothetical protein
MSKVPSKSLGLVVLVAAGLLCVGVLAAGTGAATPKTYFPSECDNSRYRPHHLIAACGDGSLRVKKIQWEHYGKRRARGHGIAVTNTCVPSCAAGKFEHDAARVQLFRPRFCKEVDRRHFTRLRVVYSGRTPPLPQRAFRFPFPCSVLSG